MDPWIILNFLPILLILGLLVLLGRWLNRHISFDFNGAEHAKVVVWVLRPVVVIGAGLLVLTLISWSIIVLIAIL